jgi:hypothetical protein
MNRIKRATARKYGASNKTYRLRDENISIGKLAKG